MCRKLTPPCGGKVNTETKQMSKISLGKGPEKTCLKSRCETDSQVKEKFLKSSNPHENVKENHTEIPLPST